MTMLAVLPLVLLQIATQPTGQSELLVTGPKVVFFGPTRAERDSIIRIEGSEIGATFDDFDYYSAKANTYVKGHGVPAEFSTHTVIMVRIGDHGIRKIDRKAIPDYLGVILTDGVQEPRLIQGIATDEELIEEIKDFFHLKN
jgi:hypothetical protein